MIYTQRKVPRIFRTHYDRSHMQGWIRLHREIKDHWIWQDPIKFKWWMDILMTCNHDDKKVTIGFKLIECKRGQTIRSMETWAKEWRVDESTVRRFMKLLEGDKMIIRENLKKTTRLTVCNYESYNDQRRTGEGRRTGKASSTQGEDTTNNNVKNDNNEEEGFLQRKKVFAAFVEWLKVNAPKVLKMNQPLTMEQYEKLTERFGKIGYMCKKMNNYKPLLQKNESAYQTIINWIEREEKVS